MASSSVQHATLFLRSLPISEKLTHGNYPLWRAQVISSIREADLYDFLSPMVEPPPKYLMKEGEDKEAPILNKEYGAWVAKHQQVLSYLLSSLSREILQQVSTTKTAGVALTAIQGIFASQFCSCLISTRMALATVSKRTSTISEYFTKIKSLPGSNRYLLVSYTLI